LAACDWLSGPRLQPLAGCPLSSSPNTSPSVLCKTHFMCLSHLTKRVCEPGVITRILDLKSSTEPVIAPYASHMLCYSRVVKPVHGSVRYYSKDLAVAIHTVFRLQEYGLMLGTYVCNVFHPQKIGGEDCFPSWLVVDELITRRCHVSSLIVHHQRRRPEALEEDVRARATIFPIRDVQLPRDPR
jgi:hypothetical protein